MSFLLVFSNVFVLIRIQFAKMGDFQSNHLKKFDQLIKTKLAI